MLSGCSTLEGVCGCDTSGSRVAAAREEGAADIGGLSTSGVNDVEVIGIGAAIGVGTEVDPTGTGRDTSGSGGIGGRCCIPVVSGIAGAVHFGINDDGSVGAAVGTATAVGPGWRVLVAAGTGGEPREED